MGALVQEAFACCRKGWGRTVVLGVDKPGAQLNFNSNEVRVSRKTLTGTLFGDLKPKSDVSILVKRYLDKELQLDKFVTHEVNFEDISKAFDLLEPTLHYLDEQVISLTSVCALFAKIIPQLSKTMLLSFQFIWSRVLTYMDVIMSMTDYYSKHTSRGSSTIL